MNPMKITKVCYLCEVRRLRSNNRSGLCGKCSISAEGWRIRHPRPTNVGLAAMQARVANSSHDFTEILPDTEPECWVTYCSKCSAVLAYDREESPEPYGAASSCPGRVVRITQPADRRDPMEDPGSSTSRALEPLGSSGLHVGEWGWDLD